MTQKGKAPLHIACENKHAHLVSLLVRHKASLDLEDREGKTALAIATEDYSESIPIVRMD